MEDNNQENSIQEQTLSKVFDIAYEQKILKLMVTDPAFLTKASQFLKEGYFSTEHLGWIYIKAKEYFDKYQKLITQEAFITEVKALNDEAKMVEYATVLNNIWNLEVTDKDFLEERLTEFIKRNIFIRRYTKSGHLFVAHKIQESFEEMQNCLEEIQKINFAPASRTFFFNDVNERIARRDQQSSLSNVKFASGILELDTIMEGGLGRGELGIVVGGPKAGKSICLCHISGHNIRLHRKVLHFQLEGTQRTCEDRYDARLLNWDYNKIKRNELPTNLSTNYSYFDNSLVIRYCNGWEFTTADIDNEIKDLKRYNWSPDMIIVDYGDLLRSRSTDIRGNTYLEQQEVFRDLKTLAGRYDIPIWTASQPTRAPQGKEPEKDPTFLWTKNHLADCYAKVRVCDLLMTINVTNEERSAKRARLYVDSYRDAECGQKININTNYTNMQFYVPTNQGWENWYKGTR